MYDRDARDLPVFALSTADELRRTYRRGLGRKRHHLDGAFLWDISFR